MVVQPMDQPPPELRTERLVLRRWRDTDREPYAALNADPEVMEHLPSVLSRADSDAHIASMEEAWDARGYGLWATERTDTGELIGFVGCNDPGFEASFTPAVEVGWRLARPHWGCGFATEAATATLDDVFRRVDRREIVSFTTPRNVRSQAVMQRLGMHRDPADDFDHPRLPVGHRLRRHWLYRVTEADWNAKRA
jgi:RimJ/RimL family protein N-acetyltransferase